VLEQVNGATDNFGITRGSMGRVTQMTYPNKDKGVTAYGAEGRITSYKNYYNNSLINGFEETLDGEGNKFKEKINLGTRN